MNINPFVAGILVTIFTEVILINILVFASIIRNKDEHDDDTENDC